MAPLFNRDRHSVFLHGLYDTCSKGYDAQALVVAHC